MPIYEFICPKNQRIYSFLARSLTYADKVPRCPDNPKWPMEKLLSGFAITGGAREPGASEGAEGGADDSRMEAAMAAMEREFGSVAESDNPDPRALAAMMRRVGEISGQPLPEAMGEILARMERGEDPEKLEAEYGDALDGMDDPAGENSPSGEAGSGRRRSAPKITRDPTLYDFSEYFE
jgi:hypothetical protein